MHACIHTYIHSHSSNSLRRTPRSHYATLPLPTLPAITDDEWERCIPCPRPYQPIALPLSTHIDARPVCGHLDTSSISISISISNPLRPSHPMIDGRRLSSSGGMTDHPPSSGLPIHTLRQRGWHLGISSLCFSTPSLSPHCRCISRYRYISTPLLLSPTLVLPPHSYRFNSPC